MSSIQVVSIIASIALIAIIFELVRQRQLREQYSILWFMAAGLLLFFAYFDKTILWLAKIFEIHYPPAILIVLVIFSGVILGIHFSIMISRLTEANRTLAQEIALLKLRIEQCEIYQNASLKKSTHEQP